MPDEITTEQFAAMIGRPKRNKYGAVRTTYNGRQYDSKAEAEYAARLDMMQANGEIDWWLRQVPIDLGPDTRYTTDFLACWQGAIYAIDVKGHETAAFRKNVALWRKYGPFELHLVYKDRVEIIEGGRQKD